jgi:formylglycine-generating enzyme required for sulfatase activity
VSTLVTGGTFYRSYDGITSGYTSQAYPATVSDFRLDKYEVTVGRFRRFVAAYAQEMVQVGAGKNPNNAGDSGWTAAWNASLPATASDLTAAVKCEPMRQTWTDIAGANENRPINCVSWYEAFAFCIWDGGRLPTEAESNYAAAGGSEQRVYPWGSTTIDCGDANFGGATFPATACVLPGTGATNDVGSESPTGDGKWGQSDLAGNLWEWTLDWYVPYVTPCQDCAALTLPLFSSSLRTVRGGSFTDGATEQHSARRGRVNPVTHANNDGIRCARSAP